MFLILMVVLIHRLDLSLGTDLPKGCSTGRFEFLLPAEVQVVSVEDAPRQTHTFTHDVVLLQPDHAKKKFLSADSSLQLKLLQAGGAEGSPAGSWKCPPLRPGPHHCRVSCVCFFLSLMI